MGRINLDRSNEVSITLVFLGISKVSRIPKLDSYNKYERTPRIGVIIISKDKYTIILRISN